MWAGLGLIEIESRGGESEAGSTQDQDPEKGSKLLSDSSSSSSAAVPGIV